MKPIYLVIFVTGLAAGLALIPLVTHTAPATTPPTTARPQHPTDAREAGLPRSWIAFGFLGQALFTGRMLAQWISTERKRQSVVPVVFWWLSLFGGVILAIYFLRRGDPVGSVGQLAGLVVYARNLTLILRPRPGPESS
ncbi:MAG: lipid-A-disaccharide synthase N-terminal domain-containing protein [Acidobacteriota bacterium]